MRRTPVHAAAAAALLLLAAAACAPPASAASAPVLLPAGSRYAQDEHGGAEQGGVWSYSSRPLERRLGSDEYEDEDGGGGGGGEGGVSRGFFRGFFVSNNVTRSTAASKTRKATATATSRNPLLPTPRPTPPAALLALEPPFYVSTDRPATSRAADHAPDDVPFEGRALPDGGELAQPAPVRPRTHRISLQRV